MVSYEKAAMEILFENKLISTFFRRTILIYHIDAANSAKPAEKAACDSRPLLRA